MNIQTLLWFIADTPEDDALWHLLAQLHAERDQDGDLEIAAFLRRDYDIIRRMLRMTSSDFMAIRREAKEHGPKAVKLIDDLIPLLRRNINRAARRCPPLPTREK